MRLANDAPLEVRDPLPSVVARVTQAARMIEENRESKPCESATVCRYDQRHELKSVFVVLVLFLCGLTARAPLLANGAPGMTSLSSSAPPSTSATSALRLKGTAHFVAIDDARKSQGHRASLRLHAERHVVASNTSRELRGTSSRILKRAAQSSTILLNLNCALLRATTTLP